MLQRDSCACDSQVGPNLMSREVRGERMVCVAALALSFTSRSGSMTSETEHHSREGTRQIDNAFSKKRRIIHRRKRVVPN